MYRHDINLSMWSASETYIKTHLNKLSRHREKEHDYAKQYQFSRLAYLWRRVKRVIECSLDDFRSHTNSVLVLHKSTSNKLARTSNKIMYSPNIPFPSKAVRELLSITIIRKFRCQFLIAFPCDHNNSGFHNYLSSVTPYIQTKQ